MSQRAFQVTNVPAQLQATIPIDAERAFFEFQSQRESEKRQRQQIDFQSGALGYKAYEEALILDLKAINPDSPAYNEVYSSLLAVREERQSMEDAEIVERFTNGTMEFNDLEKYFLERIRETAEETPEWYGLRQAQRTTFIENSTRSVEQLNAQWRSGELGIEEYISGLNTLRKDAGFVQNSPVAVGLRENIASTRLQSELNKLAEEFETLDPENINEYITRIDDIKNRFSPGSPIRAQVFQEGANALSTAFQAFSAKIETRLGTLFGQAEETLLGTEAFGTKEEALKLFGDIRGIEALRPREPLKFGAFVEQARRGSVANLFREQVSPIESRVSALKTFDFEEAQKKAKREDLAAQQKATSSSLAKVTGF